MATTGGVDELRNRPASRTEQAMRKFLRHAAMSAVLAALIVSGMATAAAAPPERETITFADSGPDGFLMEACGLDDDTTTVNLRITSLTFQDRPVGLQSLASVHIDIVSTAGDNSVLLHSVGVDSIRVDTDGDFILMIAGQVAFSLTGVLKVNLSTGELILESHTVDETRACRLLSR
jgi:hypothetical protein